MRHAVGASLWSSSSFHEHHTTFCFPVFLFGSAEGLRTYGGEQKLKEPPTNNDGTQDNCRLHGWAACGQGVASWGVNTDNHEYNYRSCYLGGTINQKYSHEKNATAVLQLNSIWILLGQLFEKCWKEQTICTHSKCRYAIDSMTCQPLSIGRGW